MLANQSVETFKKECLYEHEIKTSSADPATRRWDGVRQVRVKGHMKSLKDYGVGMHLAYDPQEMSVLFPQRGWPRLRTGRLLEDGTPERRSVLLPSKSEFELFHIDRQHGGKSKRPRPWDPDSVTDAEADGPSGPSWEDSDDEWEEERWGERAAEDGGLPG